MAGIERNLEKPGLYLNKFWSGLYRNRSPLYTPVSALGIQLISRMDTLWDGNNVQITPQFTLRRRYGFLKASSSAFGSSEWPLTWFSFGNLAGTVTPIVDTQVGVYNFTATTKSALFTKASGVVQSNFNSVANALYWCDGVSAMKLVGPNLLTQSNTFSTAAWNKGAAVTLTGGQSDPNGGATATQVACTASTGNEFVYQLVVPNYTTIGSNTFTASVWLKSVSGSTAISLFVVNQAISVIAVVRPTITGTWTRYQITGTMNPGDTQVGLYFNQDNGLATTFLAYAAQLEANGTATDVQFTTTQPQGVYLMGIATPPITPTLSFPGGSLSPLIGYQYVYCFSNPLTTGLSTASAPSANSGPQTSKNITVGGNGTADPQVTQIEIFRTKDGGSTYYFVASITNPGVGAWTYTDSTADSALNVFLIAPVAHVNDPPPAGVSLFTWYAGRLWAASGNTLYFSGGPDTLNGVGTECWPPGNNYTLPGKITALAGTSQGLLIWVRNDLYVTTGTNILNFTVPQLWQAKHGVPSQNCVAQDGDNLFYYTTTGKVYNLNPASGLSEIGFGIAAQLAAMNGAGVYVAIHQSGQDEGVFVSDGVANIYRYSTVSNSWDTPIVPVGGVGAIASIELSSSNYRLLMGRPTGSGFVLKRDTSTFSDDGSAYTGFVTIGSITVAPPRQVAKVSEILLQDAGVGTYPTVAVMLNEVTDLSTPPATFTILPNPVPDPAKLPQSLSLRTKRHDFKAATSPLPEMVQHLQVKVSFIAEAAANEIFGIGID